jgi:prepilin signal peptidase PulO-like enzyme (type II secretory pathway)
MTVVALIILGLCFGSFVNALVWRVHEQAAQKRKKKTDTKYAERLSISKGRSMCPDCKHELATKDLLPVVSWLWLRGKCRYCHKPIPDSPLVELLMPTVFVASYLFWPETLAGAEWLNFGLWLVCLVGLVALMVYDLRWMLLPNKVLFPLFIPASAMVLVEALALEHSIWPVFRAVGGVLIGGGIFYLIFQVSSGKWIGGGDVKLGFLLGLLLGSAPEAFLLLFLASLLGTLYVMPLMIAKKITAKSRIPFGPFLIVAAVIVKLWGHTIIDWYTGAAL